MDNVKEKEDEKGIIMLKGALENKASQNVISFDLTEVDD